MSTSTILAIFALIIAASCTWQVYLAILTDRQDKVIRESFSTVMDWMEKQEKINAEHEEAREHWIEVIAAALDALEARLPEFDWEGPE